MTINVTVAENVVTVTPMVSVDAQTATTLVNAVTLAQTAQAASEAASTTSQAQVAAATAEADRAETAEATAIAKAAEAVTSAASAAANSAGQNMAAILETITANAVDVFIYDTTQDDDPNWINRCSGLTWYNEALGTATRGTTRAHPKLALYVLTATVLTIYDLTEPSVPMWIVFNRSSGASIHLSGGSSAVQVTAKNGTVLVANNTGTGSMAVIRLIHDESWMRVNGTTRWYHRRGLNGRNIALGQSEAGYFPAGLPSRGINSVAISLNDNAPIDPITRMRVPTVLVSSDGGFSRINPDDTIETTTTTSINNDVWVSGDHIFCSTSHFEYICAIPITDALPAGGGHLDAAWPIVFGDGAVDIPTQNNIGRKGTQGAIEIDGDFHGVMKFVLNPSDPSKTLTADITDSYNTGWMLAPKLAALMSTTAGALSDAVYLNDPDDVSGQWIQTEDGFTFSTTTIVCDGVDASEFAYIDFSDNSISIGIGDAITVRFDITNYVSGTVRGSYAGGTPSGPSESGNGSYVWQGTLSVNDRFYFRSQSFNGTISNIRITRAIEDRSYDPTPLPITGTVTKTAAATGSEVVYFELSDPITVTLNTDISTTGAVEWWEDDAGAPKYCYTDLSGGQSYVNGQPATAVTRMTFSGANMTIPASVKMAKLRASDAFKTAEQIKFSYEQERAMFQENTKVTTQDAASPITGLSLDKITGVYSFGQGSGHNAFNGLINTAYTADNSDNGIAAHGGFIAASDATQTVVTSPAINLRAEQVDNSAPMATAEYVHEFGGSDDTVALPQGWKPKRVWLTGNLQRVGTGNDVTYLHDGFIWSVLWDTTPSGTDYAQIEMEAAQ